jgi:hypothetical protein
MWMWFNPHKKQRSKGKTIFYTFFSLSVCGEKLTKNPLHLVSKSKNHKQNSIHFTDKNTSPSHQRTISLSDIRLARLTTVSDQQLTEATLQGAAAALNGTNTSGADNIITIKQESITNVDNLVGSYVDSTTFLPSPNSQIINANLVQSIAMANDANDGKN